MTNINSAVTNFIDQDVSIRRGLTRGFINVRSLAKYIHQNMQLNCSLDAVISAIRRYDTTEKNKEDIKNRYKLLANAKMSSRTRIMSVLLKKDMEVRQSLIKLYNKIDFARGDILRILEVSQYIKIIIDQSNEDKIDSLFSEVLSKVKKLGEISLIYDKEVINTPGVFAALASELALNNISIRDGVICDFEHIFILDQDDVMKALNVLHNIVKWGERTK